MNNVDRSEAQRVHFFSEDDTTYRKVRVFQYTMPLQMGKKNVDVCYMPDANICKHWGLWAEFEQTNKCRGPCIYTIDADVSKDTEAKASKNSYLSDIGQSLKRKHARLRRSVLLVWVTAEEKGLLGSRYYAGHPTVPISRIVADINTDMFLPIVPLRIVTVYGLAESDLGQRATAAARSLGYQVQADPEPLRNLFIRSDQYSFIKQGIPSLAMKVGFEPGTPQEQVFKSWLTERYHAPSDDANQPVDLSAAAGFEELVRTLTISIANADQRPAWNPDSFFRRYATGAR